MSDEQQVEPITTLIVDDDVSFCSALRSALQRRGINALIAHNYDEAILEARAWRPARAIVDLRMPSRSGLATIEALLAELPELKIVVLTGYGSIETAVAAIKLGAQNYLSKPADADMILAAFEKPATTALPAEDSTRSLREVEEAHMRTVLQQTGGNISETARRLRINRRTLQRRLARLGDDQES